MTSLSLPPLARAQHAMHCLRCLRGVSGDLVEADSSRMMMAYYCISGLDILDALGGPKISQEERSDWKEWIWRQQISGEHGTGFRSGPSMAFDRDSSLATEYDQPHLIQTYTAILALCTLRDDLSSLDRHGIVKLLRSTQLADGSFTPMPGWGESDVRLVYCAFIISSLLNDWSGVDVDKAVDFVRKCRTYEGGYGQCPGQEASGGTTYCSIAALSLVPKPFARALTANEREETIRWLIQRQMGGFQGRTEKTQDACYSFWCGAALQILGAVDLVDPDENAHFLSRCQFKFGGIAKVPNDRPDPFHTYLSLASLSHFVPSQSAMGAESANWNLAEHDPIVNARVETAQWAMDKVRGGT